MGVQEHTEMRAIGCCPAGDPNGKPYGVGKGCCGSHVFEDDGNSFCCEYDMQVYQNTLMGITQCNNNFEIPETEPINGPTAGPQIAPSEFPSVPEEMPYDADPEYVTEDGQCPPAFWIPSPMTASCPDSNNVDSFCSFQCPPGSRVRIPDDPNRVCDADGTWHGDVPHCCEKDGCPDDLRVDFYFILDSSSSIKERNFHYIREYVSGLIATMPIGLDKTRVGIITYNSGVVERVRPDVPNFVLVLTDGRATDDVRIGAPALRASAYVVAVGVGKKIKENELKIIAGSEDRVYMVTDFRSLGLGSLSEAREGEKVSEAEQQRRNKECMKKESMEAKGMEYVSDVQESAEVQAQRVVIKALEDKFEEDGDATSFAVAMRGEMIRLKNLLANESQWSADSCVAIAKKENSSSAQQVLANPTIRFTTSYICPKSCVFDQYTLFNP